MARIPGSDLALRTLGRQLGGPSGPLGALVARMLDKGNGDLIAGAVDTLGLAGGEEAADIGFGGGVGLRFLLEATRAGGRVHGVEPSPDMLARARRAHRDEIAAGRLVLCAGRLQALPLEDGALDAWISVNTLYFVDDLPRAAGELRRVLAPAGRGVIGIADPEWMAQKPFTRHGFTLRPVADVTAAFTAAGLSVEQRVLPGPPSFHLLVCRPA